MAENITSNRDSLAMKAAKYWLPVFVMIGAMYYFSTDVLSAGNTHSLVEEVLGWFGLQLSHRTVHRLNYVVRKGAHLIEYAILAGLLFRAFRADSPVRWRLRWAVFSFLTCALWALADEFHQTFTADRSGSIKDSMLDCLGALFMLMLIAFFTRRADASEHRFTRAESIEADAANKT